MQCLQMIIVSDKKGNRNKVPCGKCGFCLTNKRSQWMFRIHHEMRLQEYPGWFLTLTYDEKHVKRVPGKGLSLRFRDVQLFLKRVRKDKFYCKYVCVGEYGGVTHRPHYHMLLWTNCPVEKLTGYWQMGAIHFGRITMQSAMYTLKYIIQPKQKDDEGIEKTRAQFSKGIGIGYLTSAVYDYHTFDYDDPVVFSYIDGRKVALPRYYKNKIFTKFQMREVAWRTKWRLRKEARIELRKLMTQGVKDPTNPKSGTNYLRRYLKQLRTEQAKRIIQSTKFNQTL